MCVFLFVKLYQIRALSRASLFLRCFSKLYLYCKRLAYKSLSGEEIFVLKN